MPGHGEYSVRQVEWSEFIETLRDIRSVVFIIEQKVPRDLEWDDKDEHAVHVLARDHDGTAVGTGRLLESGQIGRMAVLKSHRQKGAGTAIMEKLMAIAQDRNLSGLFLNAQVDAIGFYRRFGFVETGDEFMEAGIPHKKMVLRGSAGTNS